MTGKQRAFVRIYIADGLKNAADAYRRAYPTSEKWSPNARANEANKLLSHPEIVPIMRDARQKADMAVIEVTDRYALTKKHLLDELAKMIMVDPRRVFTWGPDGVTVEHSDQLTDDEARAVVEVSQSVTRNGGKIMIKLADRQEAIMNFARLSGYVPDRSSDLNVNINVQQQVAETRAQLIAKLEAMAKPEPLTIDGEVEEKKS